MPSCHCFTMSASVEIAFAVINVASANINVMGETFYSCMIHYEKRDRLKSA